MSALLLAREAAQKMKDAIENGEVGELEQSMEQRKLMAMSKKVQTLLKAKQTFGSVAKAGE